MRVRGGEDLTTTRELVVACAQAGTYKYFVPRERVELVWRRLVEAYGAVVRDPEMKTMQIVTPQLIFRATLLANPITVFRKRACTAQDVARMHELLEYDSAVDADRG